RPHELLAPLLPEERGGALERSERAEPFERDDGDEEERREAPGNRRGAEQEAAEDPGAAAKQLDHEVDGREDERPAGDRAEALRRDGGAAPDRRIAPVEHVAGRDGERDREVRRDEGRQVD